MPKDIIRWCILQKDGIKFTSPNDNLYSSYMGMANESLASMNANINAGVKRWAIVAAYYARYNALYALFIKAGIRCEIHDCTLAAAKLLFKIESSLVEQITKAKTHRINMQYYADRIVPDNEYRENINSVPKFVIEMEKIGSGLTRDDVNRIRGMLEKMIKNTSQEWRGV